MCTPIKYGGMGFRYMPTFNLAMLGKQCWRLLTEPSSLCARVLKRRYFPNEDFWIASKPQSASYTWRSILKGKKLLHRGFLLASWGRAKVSVLNDNWTPNTPVGSVVTTVEHPDNVKVNYFLDDDHKSWKVDVVRGAFNVGTADRILSLFGSALIGCPDLASWPHCKLD
jgi:hypothetical protein